MSTMFSTAATHEVESGRNRFKEPWPSTSARFVAARMTAEFIAPGTFVAYVVGTVTEAGSAYFALTGVDARIPVTPGQTVEWSADTSGTGGMVRRLRLYFLDAAGAVLPTAPVTDSPTLSVGAWQRQVVTAVVPAGAVYSGIYVLASSTVGQQLFLRNVYAGAPGGFINGSLPAAGNKRYAWAGPVNNSESIEYSTFPDVFVVPEVVDGFRAAREARTIVHDVLGSADVDVSMRPVGLRRGVLQMVFADAVAAAAGEDLAATTQLLTLTDPDVPTVGMTFVVAGGEIGLELNDETRSAWVLSVPFVEVAS